MNILRHISTKALIVLLCFMSPVQAMQRDTCSKKSNEYLFLQQYVDMCFVAPMINLHKLETLLEKYDSLENVPSEEWFSRRQWFGKAHKYLFIWHKAFNRLNNANDEEVKHLRDFVKNAVQEAPVTPHFYKENGDFYFGKLSMLAPLNFIKFLFTPFFLIDIDSMKQMVSSLNPTLGLEIPLLQDQDGTYKIYDDSFSTYKKITETDHNFEGTFSTKNRFKSILGDNAVFYNFDSVKIKYQETLGFKTVALTDDLAKGIFLQRRSIAENGYHAPHLYGLTKLIYAQLGVDENNNDILEGHKLRKVYEELRNLSNIDEQNPWNQAHLSKDKFLQYHIANILKNDSTLLEQVKKTIDCSPIKHWEYYKNFLDSTEKKDRKASIFKDRKGTPYKYDEVVTYMLGEEQALASMMMYLLRLLWVGTLHEEAFYRKLDMYEDGFKGVLISIFRWWLGVRFSDFKDAALAKKKIGNEQLSFLDVWNKVVTKIKENDRKNWISFDHHGWVFSTDTRSIELQEKAVRKTNKAKIAREKIKFLNQLGFAGIESQYGNLLNSFYVRKK